MAATDMTTDRLWVLGAPDPEMAAIERLLEAAGEAVAYASRVGSDTRVRAGDAYVEDLTVLDANGRWTGACDPAQVTVYTVECALPPGMEIATRVAIDHHRPGDPGYGRSPSDYLPASSLGQVIAVLAQLVRLPASWHYTGETRVAGSGYILRRDDQWSVVARGTRYAQWRDVRYLRQIPPDLLLVAAADHCLAAAYQGECPGVDPDPLMWWRVESRAAYQGRSIAAVMEDVEQARGRLQVAQSIILGYLPDIACDYHRGHPDASCRDCDTLAGIRAYDLRGQHIPELPEAAAREGRCIIADGLPEPDGRTKIVCQSGTSAQIAAFMRQWAPQHGVTDVYGDPARGFAGGYLQEARS